MIEWKEKGDLENVKQEGIVLTDTDDTDDTESMMLGSQPMLLKQSLARRLSTPTVQVVHNALAQGVEGLGGLSIGVNFRNEQCARVK